MNFLILFLVAISSIAIAGNESGGGGIVVKCSKSDGTSTYELLDVYEARQNKDIEVITSEGNLNKDYFRLQQNKLLLQGNGLIEEHLGAFYYEDHLNDIFSKLVVWHEAKSDLPSTNDFGRYTKLPENCELKQVAIFSGKKHTIEIHHGIWNRLDSLSQAALLMHEEIYFYDRQLGVTNSARTRSKVSQILATKGVESAWKDKESYEFLCMARNDGLPQIGKTDFFLNIRNNQNGNVDLELQFTSLEGQDLFTLTKAEFNDLELINPNIRFGLETANDHKIVSRSAEVNSKFMKNKFVTFTTQPGSYSTLTFYENGKMTSVLEIRACTNF